MDIAEFGEGIFGVEAEQRYFLKPASRLTVEETTLLAAIPIWCRPLCAKPRLLQVGEGGGDIFHAVHFAGYFGRGFAFGIGQKP